MAMVRKNARKMRKNQGKSGRMKTGAAFAALVAAVAVFIVMLQMEKSILENYEKKTAFVTAHTIPKGEVITEENFAVLFKEMELDVNCVPDTALTDMGQVKDLVTVCQIEQGVVPVQGMFESMDEILAELDEPVIAGFKADDMYQVAGGVLRAGDRIHIYTVREKEAVLEWESVYVQQVFDASGNRISNEDKKTVAQRINVYMDKEDVEAFYTGLALGTLRVVKVCE